MKATANESTNKFVPIELTITLESQDEVDQLFSIFNYSRVSEWFRKEDVILHALLPIKSKNASKFFDQFSDMFKR